MPSRHSESISKLTNYTQQYIANYIDLLKIKGSKVLINLFASIIHIIIIDILGAFSALFFGIASAKQLNQLLKSDMLGYWIIGSLFLILAVIFKSISKNWFSATFVGIFLKTFTMKIDTYIDLQSEEKRLELLLSAKQDFVERSFTSFKK